MTFEHRHRGGFIEHELVNLLPFTYYVFSIQAPLSDLRVMYHIGAVPESGDAELAGRPKPKAKAHLYNEIWMNI